MSNFIEQTLNSSTQMIETSPEVGKIFSALGQAQADFPIVEKTSVNPHFKNRYADLATIIELANSKLPAHGLSYSQIPSADSQIVSVTTMIVHGESGEWIRGTLSMVARDARPQSVGSTVTYCRRYALQSMLGIGTGEEDDDGEAGMGRSAQYANTLTYMKDIGASLFGRKTDINKWLLDNYSFKKPEEMPEEALNQAIGDLELIGTQRVRFIGLTKELGMTNKEIITVLKEKGGVDTFALLPRGKRDELMKEYNDRAETVASESNGG